MNSILFTKSQEVINFLENWYCYLSWEIKEWSGTKYDHMYITIYQDDYETFTDNDLDLFEKLTEYGSFEIQVNPSNNKLEIELHMMEEHESEG